MSKNEINLYAKRALAAVYGKKNDLAAHFLQRIIEATEESSDNQDTDTTEA